MLDVLESKVLAISSLLFGNQDLHGKPLEGDVRIWCDVVGAWTQDADPALPASEEVVHARDRVVQTAIRARVELDLPGRVGRVSGDHGRPRLLP
jgi:hypothetical protein